MRLKKYSLLVLFTFLFNLLFAQIDSNALFKSNKGKLPYPLNKVYNYDFYEQPGRQTCMDSRRSKLDPNLTFTRNKSEDVFAIFDGKVIMIQEIDSNSFVIITRYCEYFIAYAGIRKPKFQLGDFIKQRQYISSTANYFYNYNLDIYISKNTKNENPKDWLIPFKTKLKK